MDELKLYRENINCRYNVLSKGMEDLFMSENKRKERPEERKAVLGMSLLVLVLSVGVLMAGILVLKLSPHIPILVCTFIMVIYGLYLGIPWAEMMSKAMESIASSLEAIIIVMTIGMVVGSWVACGTVPYVIWGGLKLFTPAFLLPFTVVLCAVMSTLTGSSWTTVGTVGVAFLGIGVSMGIPAPVVVGAICCGAFFGDTQYPMSDGCNFATAISGAGLYNGVKGMLCTNCPALLISFIMYIIIGLRYSVSANVSSGEQIAETLAGLEQGFHMTPAVLLPAIVLFILLAVKLPAIPTMILAAVSGVVVDVFCQKDSLADALGYLMNGYVGNTGVADVDRIITRGGMNNMMSTVALMIFSMWMAGVLQRVGIISVLLEKISKMVTKIVPLVSLTNILTFVFSYFAADPYLAMTLPSKALEGAYDDLELNRSVLCRSVGNAVLFAPMVPWGSGGLYVSATLGIAVSSYIPYYFMGYLAPLLCILFAAVGIGNYKVNKD